jgi:KUP system potassium uptake protein
VRARVCSVVLPYGSWSTPWFPEGLAVAAEALDIHVEEPTYSCPRRSCGVTDLPGMARWRERLFRFSHRNATSAADYFGLPPEGVVIIAVPVEP